MNPTALQQIEERLGRLMRLNAGAPSFVIPETWREIERIGSINCPAFRAACETSSMHGMSEVDKLRLIASFLLRQCLYDRDELLRLVSRGLPFVGLPWIDYDAAQSMITGQNLPKESP